VLIDAVARAAVPVQHVEPPTGFPHRARGLAGIGRALLGHERWAFARLGSLCLAAEEVRANAEPATPIAAPTATTPTRILNARTLYSARPRRYAEP
jgi:hypothetical protein